MDPIDLTVGPRKHHGSNGGLGEQLTNCLPDDCDHDQTFGVQHVCVLAHSEVGIGLDRSGRAERASGVKQNEAPRDVECPLANSEVASDGF
jgi:hypothetical protein